MRVSNSGSRPLVPLLLGLMLARCVLPDVCLAAPPDLTVEAAQLVDAAEAEGLPTAPLVAKAREGAAKGIDAARVALALEDLAQRLRKAKAVLPADGADRSPLLSAGAAALRAGVSVDGLARLGRLPADRRADAVLAVADLVSLGIAEAQGIVIVERSAALPGGGAAIRDLGGAAAAMLGHGASPVAVANALGGTESGSGSAHEPPAYGAGGSKGKEPPGKGLDEAPGQQKK